MPPRDDTVRLRHMLDAAREARAFADGRTRADLENDRQLALSLVKCIEIVGEAATRVSEATQDRCRAIPWADVTGMRHRLIHAYYDVDLDRVWDTVQFDLPPLIASLEALLGPEGRPSAG